MPHLDFCSGDTFLDDIDFSILKKYGFPTLDEVFNKDWKGGESESQKKLSLLSLRKYTEDNTDYYDTLMSKDAFSPCIRFGCLSLKCLNYTLIVNKTNSQARFERMLKGLLKRVSTALFWETLLEDWTTLLFLLFIQCEYIYLFFAPYNYLHHFGSQ